MASHSSLVAVLAELGWNPGMLAQELNDLAALLGRAEQVHAKTPYKWLRGARPRSPWPTLVVALVSDELGRLLTPSDLGWNDDAGQILQAFPATSGLVLPWTVAGSMQAARVVTHAGSMDRRIFVALSGVAASAPVHEWLLAKPDTVAAARSSGSPLPMTVVDQLDRLVGQLRLMDDQLGGQLLLSLVHGHIHPVLELLGQRSYPDPVGRRLHATAGELLRLAGWCAFEAGYHSLAQRYWIAALHAAHAAGDQGLGANVVRSMSEQADDLGQVRASVTLAESARFGYPGACPRIAAMFDLRAAEAHAYEQASTQCRRVLDSAFDRLGDPPSSAGEPDWCYWLDEAQAHAYAGSCYLRLQDWSRARDHLHAAVDLQDSSSYPRESVRRHIDLATTYLCQDQPDVDHALAHATHAVDTLMTDVNSARCVDHLTRFISQLTPYWQRPAVRQFTDRVAALRAAEDR